MNKEHMNKEGMLNKEDITELLELSHHSIRCTKKF